MRITYSTGKTSINNSATVQLNSKTQFSGNKLNLTQTTKELLINALDNELTKLESKKILLNESSQSRIGSKILAFALNKFEQAKLNSDYIKTHLLRPSNKHYSQYKDLIGLERSPIDIVKEPVPTNLKPIVNSLFDLFIKKIKLQKEVVLRHNDLYSRNPETRQIATKFMTQVKCEIATLNNQISEYEKIYNYYY